MRIFLLNILVLVGLVAKSQVVVHVHLVSKMNGDHDMEDGSSTHFWGYGYWLEGANNRASLPAPYLEFNEGDSVVIHFNNESAEDHTIHLHGLDVDQANDGVPTTSFSIPQNDSTNYSFRATHSGNYLYHCHVSTTQHLAMGMYGMIHVHASDSQLYEGGPTFTEDYHYLASDMDRDWNDFPISPGPFHLYDANYFMVNGLSGSMIIDDTTEHVYGIIEDTILLNLANIGYDKIEYIFPVELNAEVHMSDGRVLPNVLDQDVLEVFPGERYSVLLLPESEFEGQIEVKYNRMFNDLDHGVNYIPVHIDDLSSTEDLEVDNGLKYYVEEGIVYVNNSKEGLNYTLFDVNGRLLDSGELMTGTNQIDIEGLSVGVYFIGTARGVIKLVKD